MAKKDAAIQAMPMLPMLKTVEQMSRVGSRSPVGVPRKVVRLFGERRSSVVIELSRLRGSKRYAALDEWMKHHLENKLIQAIVGLG